MLRSNRIGLASALLLLAPGITGCTHSGSFDVDESPSTKMGNLVALVQFKGLPQQPHPYDPIKCPEIVVLDGTSADRVYASAGNESNENLRYQFSVHDVARDCHVDGGQISMKVGVAGSVLLGPAGSPGSFAAPVRVVIVRETDQKPVFSKLYRVPTSVATGQTEGTFTLVTEPLTVPYTDAVHDYKIKVGFDSAGAATKKGQSADAAQAQQADAAASQGADHHHHRHRRLNADQAQD